MSMRTALLAFVAGLLVGCSGWSLTERGGEGQPCFTNGACNAGLTCIADTCQVEAPECTGNETGCDGVWTRTCQGGVWVRITDCSVGDKICEDGACVRPSTDGDEGDADVSDDDGAQDGDVDEQMDEDEPADTDDGDELADGDEPDDTDGGDDQLDEDEPDGDLDPDLTDGDVDVDMDAELDPDLEPNPDPDPEIEEEEEQEPGDECVSGPCCDNGYWVASGDPCVSGQDAFDCTSDTCDAAHECSQHTLVADKCLINTVCYDEHQQKPGFQCMWCDPANGPTAWTDKPDTEPCDDADLCTFGETCDGYGSCSPGTAVSCTDDAGICGANKSCNGTDQCTVNYPDNQTTCETDNLDCTDDRCDGGGNCTHTRKTGYCLIEGVCHRDGEENPDNECTYCDAYNNPTAWRSKPGGTQCGEGPTQCSNQDTCEAGLCNPNHKPDTADCGDAGTQCVNQDKCDGDGACSDKRFKPDGTTCGTDDQCVFGVCRDCYDVTGCTDLTLEPGKDRACVEPVCLGNACYWDLNPNFGQTCGDGPTACSGQDTCNEYGVCQQNHEPETTDCGDAGTQCVNQDKCDGDGACSDKGFKADGTTCGTQDQCVSGACLDCFNDTGCADLADDGLACSEAACNTGTHACYNELAAHFTESCGDTSDTACTNPDTCDASGICQPNHEPATTNCGDAGTQCVNQDKCDGDGACSDKGFKADGTTCGTQDQCVSGACLDCFNDTGCADLADDGLECSDPACNPGTHLCHHDLDAHSGELCGSDSYACTDDLCDEGGQCTHVLQAGTCVNNNACHRTTDTELCNGIDDNCNNETDEENASGCVTYYRDMDWDQYSVPGDTKCLCDRKSPYNSTISLGDDCDDTNVSVHPDAAEKCDGKNNDCDDQTDEDTCNGHGTCDWTCSCDAGYSGPECTSCATGYHNESGLCVTDSFKRVNAGTFTMGSPSGELGHGTDEVQHSVALTYSFEMQAKEVTQAEFTAFAGTNPSWFGPNANGADCGTNCPVERVDWFEALAYANWLSAQHGLPQCYVLSSCSGTLGAGCGTSSDSCSSATYSCTVALNGVSKPQDCAGYRLPTEAEWEYAIRAGSTTAFYNGGITYSDCTLDTNLNAIGWYCGNAGDTTHPGGGKAANAWGLYDMSGNVWEWVWDRFQAAYETDSGTNPVGPVSGSSRVFRGGGWDASVNGCRSSYRNYLSPGGRVKTIGFRLVRTLNPPTAGFTHIGAGSFTMGSPSGELGRQTDEVQHSVALTYSFEMQAKEVTQGEFTAFVGTNPSWFGPNANGADCGTDCPVERVNWYEAAAYANWLSGQKGLTPCYVLTNCTGTLGGGCGASTSNCSSGTYSCTVALNGVSKPQDCPGFRLPTEAEWEYAIRAGSTTAFYNGGITNAEQDPKLDLIGWYYYNSDAGSGRMTHPVGQKAANAWGLYDMSGNVWEWVWDWYQAAYEGDLGTNPVGPASGSQRVLRGGDQGYFAHGCRSANRDYYSPGTRSVSIGFRLVRTLNPPTPGFTHIGAGSFTMGSPSEELGRVSNEVQHSVTLTYNFEMQTKETTQAEFTAFAGTNPSWFGPNANGADCGTNCPVERVNWYEALAYANWLSTQHGLPQCYVLSSCSGTLGAGCGTSGSCSSATYSCAVALNGVSKPQDCAGYRLPTEAEWEYAIRAGSTTGFYNGEITNTGQDSKMDLIGWYYYNSDTGSGRMTHPGGQKAANAWGLYDMSGNVWEWVWDWYQAAYEGDVGTNPVGPASGSIRVQRGSGWYDSAQYCRSALRGIYSPGNRSYDVGFRLVRTLP